MRLELSISMFVLRAVRVINVYVCSTCGWSYECQCLFYVLLELSMSMFVLRAVRVINVYVCSTCG